MDGNIIFDVTMILCAVLMLGIGIAQLRSEKPVGFYSGEKPPEPEQLSDVKAWNRKHGAMWVAYGVCILAAWACGHLIGDSPLVLVPLMAGLLAPVVTMILYHHRLIKEYIVK